MNEFMCPDRYDSHFDFKAHPKSLLPANSIGASDSEIDAKAVKVAHTFRQSEAELLLLVQQIDTRRVFQKLGYSSLFDYVVRRLKLSEAVAFNLISVARKSREVPALKQAVLEGHLSVATARKIVPVINAENQATWIDAARTLPKQQLERQVATVSPFAKTSERIKPVAGNREVITFGIATSVAKHIQRAQDVLSKKQSNYATLETLFTVMVIEFLDRHDPLRKAHRVVRKRVDRSKGRTRIRIRRSSANRIRGASGFQSQSQNAHRRTGARCILRSSPVQDRSPLILVQSRCRCQRLPDKGTSAFPYPRGYFTK